jgi:hypothetical protein
VAVRTSRQKLKDFAESLKPDDIVVVQTVVDDDANIAESDEPFYFGRIMMEKPWKLESTKTYCGVKFTKG